MATNIKADAIGRLRRRGETRAIKVYDLYLDADGVKESLVFQGKNARRLLKTLVRNPDPLLTGGHGGYLGREAILPSGRKITGNEFDAWVQAL